MDDFKKAHMKQRDNLYYNESPGREKRKRRRIVRRRFKNEWKREVVNLINEKENKNGN